MPRLLPPLPRPSTLLSPPPLFPPQLAADATMAEAAAPAAEAAAEAKQEEGQQEQQAAPEPIEEAPAAPAAPEAEQEAAPAASAAPAAPAEEPAAEAAQLGTPPEQLVPGLESGDQEVDLSWIHGLTVASLKEELKSRSLPATGKKAEVGACFLFY